MTYVKLSVMSQLVPRSMTSTHQIKNAMMMTSQAQTTVAADWRLTTPKQHWNPEMMMLEMRHWRTSRNTVVDMRVTWSSNTGLVHDLIGFHINQQLKTCRFVQLRHFMTDQRDGSYLHNCTCNIVVYNLCEVQSKQTDKQPLNNC